MRKLENHCLLLLHRRPKSNVRDLEVLAIDHCGGKGVCGQCLVSVPQDVYNRLDPPSKNEQIAISTNLSIPKK